MKEKTGNEATNQVSNDLAIQWGDIHADHRPEHQEQGVQHNQPKLLKQQTTTTTTKKKKPKKSKERKRKKKSEKQKRRSKKVLKKRRKEEKKKEERRRRVNGTFEESPGMMIFTSFSNRSKNTLSTAIFCAFPFTSFTTSFTAIEPSLTLPLRCFFGALCGRREEGKRREKKKKKKEKKKRKEKEKEQKKKKKKEKKKKRRKKWRKEEEKERK